MKEKPEQDLALPSDEELLLRFSENGSEEAFRALVDRHVGMVFGVAIRKTNDRQLAEDIVQNTFAILARKAGSLAARVRQRKVVLGGWLHRVAQIESTEAMRKEYRRRRAMSELQEDLTMKPLFEDDLFPTEEIDEAIARLKAPDRDVLMLRFQQGMKFREIAEHLGKTEEAARKRVARALERLRRRLGRRGIAMPVAALGAGLGIALGKAAPAGLAASVYKGALASAQTLTFTGIQSKLLIAAMVHSKARIALVAGLCLLTVGASFLSGRRAAVEFGDAASKVSLTLSPELIDELAAVGGAPGGAVEDANLTRTQRILRRAATIFRSEESLGHLAVYYRGQLILNELTPEDLPEALDFLETVRDEKSVFQSIATHVLALWAGRDASAAVAWAEREIAEGNVDAGYAYRAILASWSRQAPEEAYAWYQQKGEQGRGGVNISSYRWFAKDIFRGWAERNPAQAIAGLVGIAVEDERGAVLGIAGAAFRGPQRQAVLNAVANMESGGLKSRVVEQIGKRWASEEPEAAAAWIGTIPMESAADYLRTRGRVAQAWLERDRGALMTIGVWMLSGAPAELRGEILKVIGELAQRTGALESPDK